MAWLLLVTIKERAKDINDRYLRDPGKLDLQGRGTHSTAGTTIDRGLDAMAQLLKMALDFPVHNHVFGRLDNQKDESCGASVPRKDSDSNGR